MVSLPNGTDPKDNGAADLERSPSCTRPLSMSNTDVKILANAFITPVATNTKHLVGGGQGCVKGRAMVSNVIRAE
eukprot:6022396-Pyramimonas_sp.AAC.1